MKTSIWLLTSDTNCGTTSAAFTTKQGAYEALVSIMEETNEGEVNSRITAEVGSHEWFTQVSELHSEFTENEEYYIDTHIVNEQVIDIPVPKVVIEIKGGALQRVISSTDLDLAVVDYDNIQEGGAVEGVNAPDLIITTGDLHLAYANDQDVQDQLKQMKF